ncbi:MAG: FAD binding domain-containing protein, partial [Oscillospiraceae bacterium]|nr:FAD binding domain-containing protein [Oscillospiraceae bacterium]
MITIQKYVRAQSLEEAWQLNQNKRNRILGGMLWLRLGKGSVGTAIDLCDLGLNTIEETEEAFSIGAMATLRDIEMHEGLNAYCGNAARNAVKDIVGVQFRNMATVGGSIWGRFGFSDVLTV